MNVVRKFAERLNIAVHFGEQPVKTASMDLTGPSAIAKKIRSRRTALDQTERPENSRNPRSRSASSGQTGKSDVNMNAAVSLTKKKLGSQPGQLQQLPYMFKNEHQKAVRVVLEREKRDKWQRQFLMQPGQYQKHPKFTKFFRLCAVVDPGDPNYTPALDEL